MNPRNLRLASLDPVRLGVAAGLILATLAAAQAVAASGVGPLSRHMGVHLLLMNVLAPLLALTWRGPRAAVRLQSGWWLAAATTAQMALLWAVHAPAAMPALSQGPGHSGVQLLLFALALGFWMTVLAQHGAARWRALLALLLTGKLACLLGVLLVFAPGELYPGFTSLADQQQAGLWMIAACPLTYVAGALALTVLWLDELGLRPRGVDRRA